MGNVKWEMKTVAAALKYLTSLGNSIFHFQFPI